ncbi:MAG: hypothetical protein J0H39_10735 [Alphaproteobacteria bacterium]|nr:hypothetical protein [Alphaproteobacteria bacterium]
MDFGSGNANRTHEFSKICLPNFRIAVAQPIANGLHESIELLVVDDHKLGLTGGLSGNLLLGHQLIAAFGQIGNPRLQARILR